MCFKSSSSTKSHEVTDSSSTPRYGQSDAFNNFMTGYNAQYTPGAIDKVQQSADINPYTTEAAAREAGIQPVLASTMDTTAQMSRDGLTEADIQRYQNPYISNVINPQLDVFNKQNRAALNNIGSKMAAQGAYRNTGKNQAVFDYYGNVLPGQNLQTAQLYKDSYDNALKTALANMQAKLQAGQTTAGLGSTISGINQTQFNMGDAIRNAGISQAMIPYQLYNQGLAGQQTAGNMYGVDQHLVSDKNSTTTNSPSPFSQVMGGIGAVASLFGGPAGGLFGAKTSLDTSNNGWNANNTTTTPASSWWPFKDGGKVKGVPAKAGGGGIGYAGGGAPLGEQVLHYAKIFSDFKGQQKAAANGGRIGKDVGGGIDDRFGDDRFLPAPLGASYGPRSDEMAPPLGEQFGPPAPTGNMYAGPTMNLGMIDGPRPDYDPEVPAATPTPSLREDYAPPSGAPIPAAQPFVPRPMPAAVATAPAYRPSETRGSMDSRGVLAGGLGNNDSGFGSWLERAGRVAMAMGPPETQRGAAELGNLVSERHKNIAGIRDAEDTYAKMLGIYKGLPTIESQRLAHQVFNDEETRRINAATLAENQRIHGSTMALQDVQTRTGEENVPSAAIARRMQEAETMGLQKGTPEYLDYVSDGKYSQGKAGKQTEFDKDNEKAASKDLQERQASFNNSYAKIAQIQRAQKIIENPNLYQGALGDWVLGAKKIGLLANMADPTGIAEGELLSKIGNEFALQARDTSNGTGMPGAMSDSDRKFLMATTLGIDKTPAGNRLMAKLAMEQETYKQALNQEAIKFITRNRSNIGLPEYLADWMKRNNAHGEDTQREGAAILQKERGMSIDEAAAANTQGLKAQAAAASGKKVVTRYQNPSGQVMVWDTKKGTYVAEDPEVGDARGRYEGGYGKNDYHQ